MEKFKYTNSQENNIQRIRQMLTWHNNHNHNIFAIAAETVDDNRIENTYKDNSFENWTYNVNINPECGMGWVMKGKFIYYLTFCKQLPGNC
jgi:hypothetical protein